MLPGLMPMEGPYVLGLVQSGLDGATVPMFGWRPCVCPQGTSRSPRTFILGTGEMFLELVDPFLILGGRHHGTSQVTRYPGLLAPGRGSPAGPLQLLLSLQEQPCEEMVIPCFLVLEPC